MKFSTFDPADPQPGIYLNLPFKDYCKIEAINASYLKKYKDTPAHTRLPDKESKEKQFGRAFHPMLLEGDKAFFKENVILPDLGPQTKTENKLKAQEYAEKHDLINFRKKDGMWLHDGDMNLISYTDYGILKEMKEALYLHPGSAERLQNFWPEVTLIWVDPITGELCKGRIDAVSKSAEPYRIHTDLKSTKSSAKYIFQNDIKNLGYYISAAFYQFGWSILTGEGVVGKSEVEIISTLIHVEKTKPYWTELKTLEPDYIDAGMTQIHEWMAKEVECRANNFWPHWNNPGAEEVYCPQYLKGDQR